MLCHHNRFRAACGAVMLMLLTALLGACNAQKKNTAMARQYTAFITRYNIYYNGDKHYKETLHDMEEKYEDDYSRMLIMHPAEAKADKKATQPSGDFKRSIEKAQKAIQVRSIKKKPQRKSGKNNDPEYKEWMKREEYNPVLHNSWMMMGRSQYFNGDFLGAASTFHYISKHFSWLPNTVTDAKLWQARSYLALDWLYEAEIIITRIKPEELTSKQLRYLFNFDYADFYIRSKEYRKAIPYLTAAIDDSSGAQATRLRFLLGQVYAAVGDNNNAYLAFKKAGSSNSASYRTKFNARIKQSEVYTGADYLKEVRSLGSMVKYDRNKDYLDQIYYAIGNLYLAHGDTTNAIDNYVKAAEKSTRNGIDKAISQVTLGGIYFSRANYDKAQPCYSEAIPQLPESYPDYILLKRRSDVLDNLAVYAQNVALQDSLLHLASLPESEQLAIIDKIISDLKKREKEEADRQRREEQMAQQAANGNHLNDNNQREFNINADNSWYFYNSTTRNSGKTEFQRRWGSRKLEDDWRRRNKTVFNSSDFDAVDEPEDSVPVSDSPEGADEMDAANKEKSSDPHEREYYLRQIPKTDAEKATAHEVIQDGLYNMGVILKDQLEDNKAALKQFNRLLTDYPDNIYRLDVYYNLYLMFMREGDTAAAETYRKLILSDFADSKYGLALSDPNYIENLKQMDTRQNELYEETFQAYLDNDNAKVHRALEIMRADYPLSKIMPKFMFLDALTYVTEKKPEEFNAVLREMLERYPDTDVAPVASAWLKGMAQGRKLQTASDGRNMRGMLWDIHLSGDSSAVANDSIAFEIDNDSPQMLVLVYPVDKVNANELLYEIARFNFNSFVVKDFDLEQMNFGRLGMLLVKGFDNQRELNYYRKVMTETPDFMLPANVEPVPISVHNFDLLLQGRTFDDYFRFLEEHDYEEAQAKFLPPDKIETLEEAEENAREIKNEKNDAVVNNTDSIVVNKDSTLIEEPTVSPVIPEPDQPKAGPAKPDQPKAGPAKPDKPKAEPVKPTQPKAQPALPEIPTGSEGDDDPLLSP